MEFQRLAGRAGLCLVLIAALLQATGCCRSRSVNRVARRGAPVAPPVISEGPLDCEVPLTLPPAVRTPSGDFGAAYGPVPGAVVVPPGSTGSSRDIRYRSPPALRPQTAWVEPRGTAPRLRPTPMTKSATPAPETPVNVPNATKPNGNASKPATPTRTEEPATTDEAIGIPHYTIVEANVATGGQPTLDGMKWLKERGFHAVLNLLPDDEADPAEASMVRELGLEYFSLPITASSIKREAVELFNQTVDDAKYRPLFIHDSTGARTGALWYLHRVRVDRVPEDRARSQAARIGLKDSDTDLWLAIQRILAEDR